MNKKTFDLELEFAGATWYVYVTYTPPTCPTSTDPGYSGEFEIISARLWNEETGNYKKLSPKELQELEDNFYDKLEEMAVEEDAELEIAQLEREAEIRREYNDYKESEYYEGLREEQMMGR